MADSVELELDASGFNRSLKSAIAFLGDFNEAAGRLADVTVKMSSSGKEATATFSQIDEQGRKITGTLQKIKGGFDAVITSVSGTKKELDAAKAAFDQNIRESSADLVQRFAREFTQLGDAVGLTSGQVIKLNALQSRLANILSSDFENANLALAKFSDQLRSGTLETEGLAGVEGKVLATLLQIRALEEQITIQKIKQASVGAETVGPTAATLASARQQASSQAAQGILSNQVGLQGVIPTDKLASLDAAQKKLATSLGDDLAKNIPIANEIVERLKQGFVDAEQGIRGRIQRALIQVLDTVRKIQTEQSKIATASSPSNTIRPDQLATLRDQITGGKFGTIDAKAGIQSIISYQSALNNLLNLASKAKLSFEELSVIVGSVFRNPANAPTFGAEGNKLAVAAQQVVAAFNQTKSSAEAAKKAAGEVGQSLVLSLDQFIKILEIQVIHRAFGAFITTLQQSITTARELSIRIAEIQTVSQNSGITFDTLKEKVRALSDQFGRPQLDVAEAIYQGFSNQVLKTANDLQVLNAVLNLSRITNSTAAQAMEAYSTVVNSYRLANFEATRVTSELFKAVELGRFRLQDVANTLGRILPIAAQLNVSSAEIQGTLAQLTVSGVSADEALTQISSIMNALLKPSTAMADVFHRLGVENGQAAISTFGFVGLLSKLFDEAQRGNTELAQLFPNVRALRGIFSSTAGGGTTQLEDTIQQIRNSGQSAENAAQLVAQSAGDKLRIEFNKIQNFFINDFAGSVIAGLQKIAEPFGGIAEAVKGLSSPIQGVVTSFVALDTIFNSVITLGGLFKVDLGLIIKAVLAYKSAIFVLTTAQTVQAAITARIRDIELQHAAVQAENILLAGGQAAAATAVTGATIAASLATQALGLALRALPFLGIAAAILAITGQFGPLFDRFNEAKTQIDILRQQSQELQKVFDAEKELADRRASRDTQAFTADLTARTGAANRVLAELRRTSNDIVDLQNDLVKKTEENTKEGIDRVRRSLSDSINALSRDISKFKANIDASSKFEASFKDREQARQFEASLAAAGTQPEIRQGLSPIDPQGRQAQIEQIQRQGRINAALQQQALIQQRIDDLQRAAQADVERGDQTSIESARRKFEEIRRLTTQDEEIARGERKARALDGATDAARVTGQLVSVTFDNGLDRLRERLGQIQTQEEQAEQSFRLAQASRQNQAEQARRVQQLAQDRFVATAREIENLKLLDNQGNVRPQFQDRPGEPPGNALARFNAEFDRLQERLRQAAREGNADPATVEALIVQLGARRIALEQQFERQITNNSIAELQRRLNEQQRIITEARTRAQQTALESGSQRDRVIQQTPEQLADLLDTANRAFTSVPGRNVFGAGIDLSAATEAFRQFNAIRLQVAESTNLLVAARGTDREAAATQELQQRVTRLADSYRALLLITNANSNVPGQTQTGTQLQGTSTILETTVARLSQLLATNQEAQGALQTAQATSDALAANLRGLPDNLREVAANFAIAARITDNQTRAFTEFGASVERLVTQLQALQAAPPLVLPVLPPAAVGGGFADGGLIGNRFSARGADDTLIWAKRGEFVVNPESTRRFHSTLMAINAGNLPVRHYASGGVVSTTTVGDVTINVDGARSPKVTARAVQAELKRLQRRGG